MATDSLIFPCPACGIKLSVPLSIAGISGPCPSCWKQIQSPRANVPPSAASLAPAARKSQDAEPPHEPDDFPAPKPDPACTQLPESADSAVPGGSRPVARPLPKRTVPEEIVIDEPENRIGCMWNAHSPPPAITENHEVAAFPAGGNWCERCCRARVFRSAVNPDC